MELFQEMAKYGIPDVKIGVEEWREAYANTYNILKLSSIRETTLTFAAEDIIMIYLLQEAKKKGTQPYRQNKDTNPWVEP